MHWNGTPLQLLAKDTLVFQTNSSTCTWCAKWQFSYHLHIITHVEHLLRHLLNWVNPGLANVIG